MKKIFLILFVLTINFVAFAQENADKNSKKVKENAENVEKRSSILFKNMVYDFGAMEKGGDASCTFSFKNISKNPVTITNVKTSCGCTAAEYSKEPIAKKKKGFINVRYDSNRVGKFTKTIKVYVDGSSTPIQLEIRGTILAPNANKVSSTEQSAQEVNQNTVPQNAPVMEQNNNVQKMQIAKPKLDKAKIEVVKPNLKVDKVKK